VATFSLNPLPARFEVETLWRELSNAAPHSFFTSWHWIGTWLASLPEHVRPCLLTIREGNLTIAAGVLVPSRTRRLMFNVRGWALHATGDKRFDQIFIEHNDLLIREGYASQSRDCWAEAFAGRRDWDEIDLRGVAPDALGAWNQPGLRLRPAMELTSRFANLEKVRGDGRPFVEQLGSNTRARVRSTQRSFEARFGPVRLETAVNIDEAFEYFDELKVLHQEHWTGKGEPGAFAYPFFVKFHHALIRECFAGGMIQLLRVKAGGDTVGVLYNFVYGGDALMYQSGLNYALVESRNKQSPGLLVHAMAVQHNADRGHRRYDFLAGDGQYKQSLANDAAQLWWGAVQRESWKSRTEEGVRRLWRRARAVGAQRQPNL
jgi:CelD/BcsL family acetyltransferase involved in cellulose biosynthesis